MMQRNNDAAQHSARLVMLAQAIRELIAAVEILAGQVRAMRRETQHKPGSKPIAPEQG